MIVDYISESCLGCGKKFSWHEPIIVKFPECACFGLCCEEKYPDEKQYDGENEGWLVAEYEPGLTLEKDEHL